MLDIILSQTVNGLVLGFVYVLIAIGLSIIFGLLGIVNFAHGVFVTLGAYFALTLSQYLGWPGLFAAPLLVGLVGMLVEVTLIRRIYGKSHLTALILTFSLALLVEALIRYFWGSAGMPFPTPHLFRGFVVLGPVRTTTYRVAVIGITILVLAALWAFLNLTPFGRIVRAGSRDPEMVQMLGINFPRILTGVFGLGCFLAGIAGVLAAPIWTVTPSMSSAAITPAFVVVTIGGLGSYFGAVVAGLLVGLVTSLTVQFAPQASASAMYILMAVVLLVRPRGLFGERWEQFE